MFVAIMGYGVIGSGVAALLKQNRELICKRANTDSIEVKYILDLRTFPGDPNEHLVINDFQKIVSDPEVKVVVETMGGLKPAYDFVLACLNAGKSVVTSNKELVAEKGSELLAAAKANNVNFMFEASVGGGIPIIRPITRCLAANEIIEIAGILNGTTNFILTKMIEEGMDFDDALAVAQKLGYAEKNPSADVDGIDALRKICILGSLCFGKHIYPENIYAEGIRGITAEDVAYAKSYNSVIKLIASASKIEGSDKINIMVSPAIIKNGSQLASTRDVFNAVLVRGNAVGDVVFYGKGAGSLPTASAVVADVMDCALHSDCTKLFGWEDTKENITADHAEFVAPFYVRADCEKSKIDASFGAAVTYINCEGAPAGEIAFATEPIKVKDLEAKLASIGVQAKSIIRITDY